MSDKPLPTIGRIVQYKLGENDVAAIHARRKASGHRLGNDVDVGQVYAATIVRVWGDSPESAVNLQVHLDGFDCEWVTSRTVGDHPYNYAWPQFAPPKRT